MNRKYIYDLRTCIVCSAAIAMWVANLVLRAMKLINDRMPQSDFIWCTIIAVGWIGLNLAIICTAYARLKKILSTIELKEEKK